MSLLTDKIELSIQEAELGTQQALSQFPPFLKWLLILGILAIIPSYLIAKNISYKIWVARYAQGQLTAKKSFTDAKDPKWADVSVTTLGDGVYSAVIQINNPNLDLSANNIPYQFSFLNSKKEVLYTETGKLFLLPNQTKYVIVPRFNTTEQIVYANFQLQGKVNWQKKLKLPEVKFNLSQPNTYQQALPPAFVAEGDFTNQSPYTLKQVRLTFVLFDSSQKIIGTSQRDEFTVTPFERRTFKQLWPNLYAPNFSSVKVMADTNTLDPSNLSVDSIPTNSSSSDLSRPKTQKAY